MPMRSRLRILPWLIAPGGCWPARGGSRFTSQARADLARSAALALVRSGHRYGLGNVLPYGRSGVVNLAVAFPTGYAERILLTGFQPPALTPFLDGELRKIPGVRGSHNYV